MKTEMIETKYKKWLDLNCKAENEFDQKKADRVFLQILAMFENIEEFRKWWDSKINHTITAK